MCTIDSSHFEGIADASRFPKYACVKFVDDAKRQYGDDELWGDLLDQILKQDATIVIIGQEDCGIYTGLWHDERDGELTLCVLRPSWLRDAETNASLGAAVKAKEAETCVAEAEEAGTHTAEVESEAIETRARRGKKRRKMTVAERLERIEKELGLD